MSKAILFTDVSTETLAVEDAAISLTLTSGDTATHTTGSGSAFVYSELHHQPSQLSDSPHTGEALPTKTFPESQSNPPYVMYRHQHKAPETPNNQTCKQNIF